MVDADGHRPGRDRQPRVRPLPRLAQVSGPRRADLGSSGLLPGQRGVRVPRPVAGLGQPPLDGPVASPASRSSCTPRSSSSEGDVVHWFHLLQDGRTGFVAGRMRRITCSGWPGRWSSMSARPGTSPPRRADALPRIRALSTAAARLGKAGMGFDPLRSSREDTDLPPLPQGDRPRARPTDGSPRPALDRHRRLERRPRRDRQQGAGRKRLARLLPLLHPRTDGPDRRRKDRGDARQDLYLESAPKTGRGPRIDLAGRPLPPRDPRRRHRDRHQGQRSLGDRRPDGRLGRDGGHQPRPGLGSSSRRPCGSSKRRRPSCSAGRRSARTPSPTSAGVPPTRRGVRENGMYCHGVQWLVGAARLLADRAVGEGRVRRRPPLSRGRLPALAQGLAPPARRARPDRDLRRPAQQAGGRHGHDLRPRPDDLARLHRGRRLDVPPGHRRRPRLPSSSAGAGHRPAESTPTATPADAWRGSRRPGKVDAARFCRPPRVVRTPRIRWRPNGRGLPT